MKTIEVRPEFDAGSFPPFEGQFKSFNRKHYNYVDPNNYGLTVDAHGDVSSTCIGFRRKLSTGTVFVLSYYEHGACVWRPKGEGPRCRFDSAQVAGLFFLEEHHRIALPTLEKREEYTRNACRIYTQWCNGEVYYLTCGDESIGFVYADNINEVASELAGDNEFEVVWI